jgi:hypothetical protein
VIFLGAGLLVLAGGLLGLISCGLRAGDRAGDLTVIGISRQPGAVLVSLSNPGPLPVLVGLSLRRPGLRLRLEAGTYVSRSRAVAEPLPPVVGVLAPGETGTLTLAASPRLGERAELQIVVGQEGRLRTIHREVRLTGGAQASRRRNRKAAITIETMAQAQNTAKPAHGASV